MSLLSDESIERRILSLLSTNINEHIHRELAAIDSDKSLNNTTLKQLVACRLGQGVFRDKCLELNPCCPVTGVTFSPLLRASHIKPWAACESFQERLDPYNGLMLAAHIDVLFDQGWISFENNGLMLISTELEKNVAMQFSLSNKKIKPFPEASYVYLNWHRNKVFR